MKKKNKSIEVKNRKKKIIDFVRNHPFCSRDSIFTKGGISKSKLTVELLNKLIKGKKIKCLGRKKQVYYLPQSRLIDLLKQLEYLKRDIKHLADEESSLENKIFPSLLAEFLKIRLRVINAEKNRIEKHKDKTFEKDSWQLPIIKKPFRIIPLNDTLERLKQVVLYHKNPSKFDEMLLTVNLVSRIADDEYYLKHQLHSNPHEKLYPFQKTKKTGVRLSTSDLIEPVFKGRHEFGISLRRYQKNMKKLGVYPGGWLQRMFAESGRSLYSNTNNFNESDVPDAVAKRDTSVYHYIIKPWDKVMDRVGLRRENKSFMKKKPKKINRIIIKELKTLFKENKIEFYSNKKELLDDTSLIDVVGRFS